MNVAEGDPVAIEQRDSAGVARADVVVARQSGLGVMSSNMPLDSVSTESGTRTAVAPFQFTPPSCRYGLP